MMGYQQTHEAVYLHVCGGALAANPVYIKIQALTFYNEQYHVQTKSLHLWRNTMNWNDYEADGAIN